MSTVYNYILYAQHAKINVAAHIYSIRGYVLDSTLHPQTRNVDYHTLWQHNMHIPNYHQENPGEGYGIYNGTRITIQK